MKYEPAKGKTAPSTTARLGLHPDHIALLEQLGIALPAPDPTKTAEKVEVFTEEVPQSLQEALERVIEPLEARVAPLRKFLEEIAAQVGIKVHLPSGDEGSRLILGGTGNDTADDAFQKIANWGNFFPVCRKDGIHFQPIPAPEYDIDDHLLDEPSPMDRWGSLVSKVDTHRETGSSRPDFALLPPEIVVRDLWDFICQMGSGYQSLFDHGLLDFARMEYAHHLLNDANYLPLMRKVRSVIETAGFRIPEKRNGIWVGDYRDHCEISSEIKNELSHLSSIYWGLDRNETRFDFLIMRYVVSQREQLLVRKPNLPL